LWISLRQRNVLAADPLFRLLVGAIACVLGVFLLAGGLRCRGDVFGQDDAGGIVGLRVISGGRPPPLTARGAPAGGGAAARSGTWSHTVYSPTTIGTP